MSSTSNKQVTLPLEITLKDTTVAVLDKGKGKRPLGEYAATLAARFLTDHAEGGLMLPNSVLANIEKLTGASFSTANEVAAAFLKAREREDGQVVVKASVDPALLPVLEEAAGFRGMTVHELASDMFNYAIGEGWLCDSTFDGLRFQATEADKAFMDEVMGKKAYTLTEFMAVVRPLLEGR